MTGGNRTDAAAEVVAEATATRAISVSSLATPMPASAAVLDPGRRLARAEILTLQRSAGNRAVGALIGARAPGAVTTARRLQRYESGEHVQFMLPGDLVQVGGLSGIDARYLVAMGDYYRTPEALMGAKADELKELMALIDQDEAYRKGKVSKPPSEEQWQSWSQKWRPKADWYMELNKSNESHFAPRNKARFDELHKRALLEAQKSGHGSGNVSNLAKLLNGFATHYLTDAFSAGHLIDKLGLMDQAKGSLDTGNNRENLASAVATGLLADQKASAALAKLDIKDGAVAGSWGPATQPRLASLLASVMRFKKQDFLSVFARLAHDELNLAISSGRGVWVQNKKGDRWQLSGDTTLGQSPRTLEIARKAVKASQDNLVMAAGIQNHDWPASWILDPIDKTSMQRFLDNVWQYVPEPTKQAMSGEGTVTGDAQVQAVIAKFTDVTNRDTVDAMVKLSVDQFDTALGQLRENGLVRDHQP